MSEKKKSAEDKAKEGGVGEGALKDGGDGDAGEVNNADLNENIANALGLANSSISRHTPEADANLPLNLEALLAITGLSNSAANTTASAAAHQQDSAQSQDLLSLLSSKFLSKGDFAAAPGSDPSLFLPTPFAPGENAITLALAQQEKRKQEQAQQQRAPPINPAAAVPSSYLPVQAAGLTSSNLPGTGIPNAAAIQQQQLLQQLAAACGVPGASSQPQTYMLAGQPAAYSLGGQLYAPVAAPAAGLGLNYQMLGGNLNPHLLSSVPGAVIPGYPAGVPALAYSGIAAGLPGVLSSGGLQLPGLAASAGLDPSVLASLNMAASPSANAASASGVGSTTQTTKAPPVSDMDTSHKAKNSKSKKSKEDEANGSDLLFKSREARWIIRYNELLEVRYNPLPCITFASVSCKLSDSLRYQYMNISPPLSHSSAMSTGTAESRTATPRIANCRGGL